MKEFLGLFEIKLILTSILFGVPALWAIIRSPKDFPDKHIVWTVILVITLFLSLTLFLIGSVVFIWSI